MMAVDLHRGGELLLSSDQFQLADINDDGVSFSENLRFDPQKPWLHSFDEFSSPVSSSPESETDQKDDCCIAELTRDRIMTHCLSDPDDEKRCRFPPNTDPEKQNELRDFGGWGSQTTRVWSPFGSSYGSPEGPSLEPTPPATPVIEKRQYPWDYGSLEITAKLEDMNMNNEGSKYSLSNNQYQSLPMKPNSDPILAENPTSGSRKKQALTLDQVRAIQFYKLKQELILKQQSSANIVVLDQKFETHEQNHHHHQNHLQLVKKERSSTNRHAWPSSVHYQKQRMGSGMRAVFLGGSGSASGSCGTGVFLPCVIGDTSQSRKKRGLLLMIYIPSFILKFYF
ncbi:G patch domain protein [Trema orientale]|uniref:G patch domain protein n=1 Tax=Trema orientale TaxID=63057 RepID=A0A2P5E606_TREOI|nr:G patch domain protein [Trema orientale]